ncbi:carbohydrate-binding domain-containing protein [Enterococcus faecium]|nr:carbohydrate-binding domain-containing protein [Enterococcus faecium]EME8167969.1 carbohydrate-binding domain-containing protein [Enterococcus faecium]
MKKTIYTMLLASLFLASCSQSSSSNKTSNTETSNSSSQTSNSTSEELANYYGKYEEEDLSTEYDETSAAKITLDEEPVINGNGATAEGETVTISEEGTYVLSGTLSDGQLIINASKEAKIHLIFNGVSITNTSGSAVNIQQAEKVILTLADNKTNNLKDGENYSFAENETEPDATLYSKEDLTINGTGTLKVNGNYSNGIRSKDDLVLVSGTYEVTAKNNAIKGKDSVSIRNGNYNLNTTEGDAIQANNTEDETKGYVAIDGGTFEISSGRDGIQAETNTTLQNAEMTIKTADGANSQTINTNESYKGIKAGNQVKISSGTYSIDSADDSIHSNNTFELTGGTITAKTGDDGIHADNELTISAGVVDIQQSYEGIESAVINFKDGQTKIVASDDGVNAGGGNDTSQENGKFGADSFGGAPDESYDSKQITISGGTLSVNSEGDGLDSNGNITMSGGTVTVDGPTNGGNGALDYGGTFDVSGGSLVAAGASGMAQTVSDSSTQGTIAITFDSVQSAGTLISIKNSSGDTVVTYQPAKDYQTIVISTKELITGDTYSIVSGGTANTEPQNGLFDTGSETTGTELGSFTLSENTASVSQSGETISMSQMAGPGGR